MAAKTKKRDPAAGPRRKKARRFSEAWCSWGGNLQPCRKMAKLWGLGSQGSVL